MTPHILIVDDNLLICTMIEKKLRSLGYEINSAHTLQCGLKLAEQECYDIVILDIGMPDGDGLDTLPMFVRSRHHPEVIIITGTGSLDGAERAILGGAWTYIEKTNIIRDLPLHLIRALEYRKEKRRAEAVPVILKRKHIIGDSEVMLDCFENIVRAAASDVDVLLTGQTGTGKEIFARTIHDNSPRSSENFVVVDCASLPENLLESTLFGHVRGAFTGAEGGKEGLIKFADQGTLFLDEIGELPLSMQKTFLRVLQYHTFRPLGAGAEVHSNFRLIAATNRDLEEMVNHGHFREDLLYRLKGLTIHLPPLKKRKEDIEDLVVYYLKKICARTGEEAKSLSSDFLQALILYDWPGNVRELFQTIEQAFARAINTPTLFSAHLPQSFRIRMVHAGMASTDTAKPEADEKSSAILPWRQAKEEMEKKYVLRLMEKCRGDISLACTTAGLSRARLYQLINKHLQDER